MGALSVTWDEHYRAPFQPLIPGVTFVDPTDPAAVAAAVTTDTAAIIVEPIQGEGGVRPISPAHGRGDRRGLPRARARCSSPTKCSAGAGARARVLLRARSASSRI